MKQQPVRSPRRQRAAAVPSGSVQSAAVLPFPGFIGNGFWDRFVRVPPPEASNPRWHVSPVIDMAAYHFSWVWLLVPMMLSGPDRYQDYLWLFAIAMAFNFAHRHYGLPYAYLDNNVFHTHRRKLTWFPLLCVVLLLATPYLLSIESVAPVGRPFVSAVVFISLLWNFWHTYMQKYGIMRLYMAKDAAPAERKTPGWSDRLLIFCWFPLFLTYAAPKQRALIVENGPTVAEFTTPLVDFLQRHTAALVIPSALFVAVVFGVWIRFEWRANRLGNHARLSAALGISLLSSALLWADPIKVYVAFAFSHAVEYMVFVWAYQRRAYRTQQRPPTLNERLLRHPVLWYVTFTAVLLAAGSLTTVYGRTLLADMHLLGMPATRWVFYYAVYESLVHFYADGFLWKMRRAPMRANI